MAKQRRELMVGLTAAVVAAAAGSLTLAGAAQQSRREAAVSSPAFERFRSAFFEDPNSLRDGLDTPTLVALTGDERTRAEDMLIAALPDWRAVIGLGALGSRRAEPRLIPLFLYERRGQLAAKAARDQYWNSYLLIYAARSLWQIAPDPRWRDAITDVLLSGGDWTQRQTAATALYDVRDPATLGPLVQALDDEEGLVRYHAARALLAMHGLAADSADPQHMIFRVMSKDPARRDGGKSDILAAIAGRPISVQ
jgi:HEAT repeat protein